MNSAAQVTVISVILLYMYICGWMEGAVSHTAVNCGLCGLHCFSSKQQHPRKYPFKDTCVPSVLCKIRYIDLREA